MKKKGVSPVIATILLVGMVIALALIVFVWMRAFAKETITKFEGENIELSCDKVEFQASYSGGQLSVSNTGNVPIYDLRIKVAGPGGFVSKNARDSDSWNRNGLNAESSFAGYIEGLEGDEITLIPILLGNSEKGMRVFACDEKRTGYTI